MSALPPIAARVMVQERIAGHVLKGHPWLYVDVLPPGPKPARTGDIVQLVTREGKALGLALFDAVSPIALRVLTLRKEDVPGTPLWTRRVREALTLRRSVLDFSTTNAFRLLHGEGDRLPGVVVDHYAGFLVLKLDTPAWLPHLDGLVEVLHTLVPDCRGIYFKGMTGQRNRPDGELEEDEGPGRMLWGEAPPANLEVLEHGMRLEVDVYRGQKTGFFLDQRENRRLIRQASAGREVLNLFSYTGGFSVAAALGGASRVVSVDISRGAVEGAARNFELNGFLQADHEFVAADVFDYLTECAQARRQFDLVIVDPPSFAPRESAVKKAVHAYRRLNEKALRQVRPGGMFASASCSSHIPQSEFEAILKDAAVEARRPLRQVEIRGAGGDHPVPLHFPEGRYLKFMLAMAD